MAADLTVFEVTPDAGTWRIDRDGKALLAVQSKEVAVDEAVVQARGVTRGKVVVRAADGSVEEEATFGDPAPAAQPQPQTAVQQQQQPQPTPTV